jgi:hypothetical protein
MNEVSEPIARWLEHERRTDRVSAAIIAVLALGGGLVVFLLTTLLIYTLLSVVCGTFVHPAPWVGLLAFGLTAAFFVRIAKSRQDNLNLTLDPMGFWILKDISSIGPRLIVEGLRQVRCCAQLGELNVAACARALAYLAAQNAAITFEDLVRHCSQLPAERLREQLLLLDGVLFLGKDGSRVTLMDPFRLRLRWMQGIRERAQSEARGQGPARPKPQPPPQVVPVTEPEKLGPYEILGLSPSASMREIKLAYRKRIKECHPDLFAGMDQQGQALAERWTRALNAAYATLNPRHQDPQTSFTRHR